MTSSKRINWDKQPLGKVSDVELSRRLEVSRHTVARQRDRRGIFPFRKSRVTEQDFHLVNLSNHDIHVTTRLEGRLSIYDLPQNYRLMWTLRFGWRLMALYGSDLTHAKVVAQERESDGKWLVLDVKGITLCDSRTTEQKKEFEDNVRKVIY